MEDNSCIHDTKKFEFLKKELGQALGSKDLAAFLGLDKNKKNEIIKPEEVAQYFRKSLSWVYKNWRELGRQEARGFSRFSQ